MANISKAEREKRAAESKDTEMADESGLIRMIKGADALDVHPTCVKAHESIGWKVAE